MKRRWAVTVAVGAVGLVGLAGCGASAAGTTGSAEDQAIHALGISDTGQPQPSGSATPKSPDNRSHDGKHRHPRLNRYLLRHTLHGDVTVRTKKGPVDVAVQRGEVTSVSATSMTVRSSDGFSETWTLTGGTKVRADRKAASRSAITKGEQIGVAGRQSGNTDTARLVVVIKK
ncbi:hypothetical protein [Actinocatenispora rupis]|uniref:DUF5666 domain-containing protein n=1 Tax=Actinocatenispora rupis TaxID=519421 RepID=A0A8J3JAW2_9ACTN|nr:hypothetical protein [Actinocatenispora rupis]GID13359.1 hypothetical protein Aru02nite_42480 [Actinocatenispora rupis]